MSIRLKLIITYTILVILSVFVIIGYSVAINVKLMSDTFNSVFGEQKIEESIHNFVDLLAEIKQVEKYESERLINQDFIKSINDELTFTNVGIIVFYNNTYKNYSSLNVDKSFYKKLIPTAKKYDSHKQDEDVEKHVIEYLQRHYFYIDFQYLMKGEEVVYFFVVDATDSMNKGNHMGNGILHKLLVLIVIIMLPLLYIMSKDIIKPLKVLESGVENIKQGNLDFHLNSVKNNEIGKVINSFETMREELKKSIEKQIQYEENRKELISSISHDLKTPMTSIKGYVEGIMDGVANTPEKMEKYLQVIHQKSEDMDKLIDDLFLFSKLDLNRIPFEMKGINVISFIEETVEEIRLEWESGNQKVRLNIDDAISLNTKILIDPQRMKRVILNIIQNSIKYMDKAEKEININVNNNDKYVQIIIADNGMGIEEKHIHQIFEKFYRIDESRNTKAGGSGLGLAIVKQIVEGHGGVISIKSVLKEGTKVILELKKSES